MIELNNTYNIISGLSIVSLLVFGFILLFATGSNIIKSKKYTISKTLLGISYIILAVFRIVIGYYLEGINVIHPSTYIFISSSTIQASIILLGVIRLLNSGTVNRKSVTIMTSLSVSIIALLYGSIIILYWSTYEYILVITTIIYLIQLFYAFSLFIMAYKKNIDRLDNNHESKDIEKLRYIKSQFFTWFGAAIVSSVSFFVTKDELIMFFVIAFTLFYAYMALQFLGYTQKISKLIHK